jgi:hypothetical protein
VFSLIEIKSTLATRSTTFKAIPITKYFTP